MRLDNYDLKILKLLQHNGRITKTGLAEAINLSVTPCWERVKKLEASGVIMGYTARINTEVLFKQSTILVEVSLKQHNLESFTRFESAMLKCPKVVECYAIGGGKDYILKVVALDIDEYQQLIESWLQQNIGIERYFTFVVTKMIKNIPPEINA